jgi:geranylgeranyl diphosphate synthase type I
VGQQLDVLGSSRDGAASSAGNLDDVYRLKTGSYTVLGPLQLGAALCDAPPQLGPALEAFALPLGIAFQLRDDLLGAFGDPARTGKPRGSDLIAGKRTLLLQAALSDPKARAALAPVVANAGAPAAAVEQALDAISACGARASVELRIGELTQRARAALEGDAFDGPSRSLLEGVLSALIDRGL